MAPNFRAADEAVRAARVKLANVMPYFSKAIFAFILVPSERCPTMGNDKWGRLYYNPDWVNARSVSQLATVVFHEVDHKMNRHHERAIDAGVAPGMQELANFAMDFAINPGIRDQVKTLKTPLEALPDGAAFPDFADLPEGEPWEFYYHELLKSVDSGGRGKLKIVKVGWNCGSGAHGVPQDWEEGPPDGKNVEGLEDGDWKDIERQVAQDIIKHSKDRGLVPGHWVKWANGIIRPRRISWEDELASGLRWTINDVSGMVLHSYARPSRRQQAVPNVIFPTMRKPQPRVACVRDTSGSMSDSAVGLASGVIMDVCRSLNAVIDFIDVDAAAHGGFRHATGSQLEEVRGRAGTDMCVGIAEAAAAHPKYDVVLVLTDCGTGWPPAAPALRVIVGAINVPGEGPIHGVPSWAKIIRINTTPTEDHED